MNIKDGTLLNIYGNFYSMSSELDISNGNIYISGDVNLLNSILKMTAQSNLTINGCITLNNITIDLDTSSYTSNEPVNITLFTFSETCQVLPDFNLKSNSDECTVTTHSVYKNTVIVTILKDSRCNSPNTVDLSNRWIIITIATMLGLIFLIIVAVIVISAVPSLKERIFPFRTFENEETYSHSDEMESNN